MVEKNTKELIFEEAKRLFYDDGYDITKCANITANLKFNKSTITYHYGTKGNLASIIMEQYFDHFSEIIIDKLMTTYGFYDLKYIASMRYFVFFHALEQDSNLRRFFLEYTCSNPSNNYNKPSVDIIASFNKIYKLNLDQDQIDLIALSNYTAYWSLAYAYFSGTIQMPLDKIIEYKIKLTFELLRMSESIIEEIYLETKKLYEGLKFTYEPYFIVK